MFLEKSKSIDLQQHQLRSFSSRNFDKCNLESNDRFIQIRITSYLNATISFAFETIDFEIFKSTHARENLSRQFSILIHFLIFRFSTISSTLFNFRTLSRTFYHLLNWQLNHIQCLESWERMKIFILKEYWFEEVLKVLCFSNLSLVTLFLWESHYFERVLDRVNLFCFYFSRSLYHSFRKNIMIWEI